jgi:uncharacterized protein DUF6174
MARIGNILWKLIGYGIPAALLCAVVVAVLTLIGPPGNLTAEKVASIREENAQARTRWRHAGSVDYDIEVRYATAWCFVDFANNKSVTLHVREGEIVSHSGRETDASPGCPKGDDFEEALPPELFNMIPTWLAEKDGCMNILEVAYDATFGYPTLIRRASTRCSDAAWRYEFSNFKPVKP